ncbi:MAG: TRAP transporter small permease [Oscillospiraceae bacterium]|nr:TRAP transporter small permease [Oscillospiraceae bacterium]
MKKIYKAFCRFEEVLAMFLLGGLAALVFISALMRTLKHPLNWAQDVALVAFAWLIFFGSDIAVRGSGLIGIDMFVKRLPKKVQKALDILFKVMILVFLCILVYYGIRMTRTGWKRQITALGISYGWVTMAVPTGSFFMIISTTLKLIERIKTPADQEMKKVEGREIA